MKNGNFVCKCGKILGSNARDKGKSLCKKCKMKLKEHKKPKEIIKSADFIIEEPDVI